MRAYAEQIDPAMKRTRPCASDSCDQPTRDTGIVCDTCIRDLERALGDVAALHAAGRHLAVELLTAETRQARVGEPTGGARPGADWTPDDLAWPQTAASTPLPFDTDAHEMAWVLGNTLSTWARVLIDTGADSCPAYGRPPVVAAWLMRHLDDVRHHQAAAELVDEITAAVRAVEREVDRPAGRWYAGPCECGAELYARPGADEVRCPDCDLRYDALDRRSWLLEQAEDTLAHAELIANAITTLGEPVTPAMIRGYANRGRILPRSVDLQGRPLYRVGDVLDVARDVLRAKAERRSTTTPSRARSTACA